MLQLLILFETFFNESNCKLKKIWVDKGCEFYNKSMKSWLQDNDIETYSTHNEENSVVAGRFISSLKNKIHKYMTSISKKVYIDKLADIVKEHNNTYYTTIKLKPVDVKSSTYIDFNKENNEEDPKLEVGDQIRT